MLNALHCNLHRLLRRVVTRCPGDGRVPSFSEDRHQVLVVRPEALWFSQDVVEYGFASVDYWYLPVCVDGPEHTVTTVGEDHCPWACSSRRSCRVRRRNGDSERGLRKEGRNTPARTLEQTRLRHTLTRTRV